MLLTLFFSLICTAKYNPIPILTQTDAVILPSQTIAVRASIPYVKENQLVTILPRRAPNAVLVYAPPIYRDTSLLVFITNITKKPLVISKHSNIGALQYHECTKSNNS